MKTYVPILLLFVCTVVAVWVYIAGDCVEDVAGDLIGDVSRDPIGDISGVVPEDPIWDVFGDSIWDILGDPISDDSDVSEVDSGGSVGNPTGDPAGDEYPGDSDPLSSEDSSEDPINLPGLEWLVGIKMILDERESCWEWMIHYHS